jgi:hypothetical protein
MIKFPSIAKPCGFTSFKLSQLYNRSCSNNLINNNYHSVSACFVERNKSNVARNKSLVLEFSKDSLLFSLHQECWYEQLGAHRRVRSACEARVYCASSVRSPCAKGVAGFHF